MPGAAPVAGREERVLDARGDDLDPPARIAVEAAELALLLGAADADRVGAVDDLGLGPLAPDRLRIAALGLDPGEGVERGDERQLELVLDAVRDEAAEPVVGVHHVGAGTVLEVVDHGVAELVDDVRQVFLGEVERPAGQVHDPVPRLDLDDLGQPGTRRRV